MKNSSIMWFLSSVIGVVILIFSEVLGSPGIIYGPEVSQEALRVLNTHHNLGAYMRMICAKHGNKISMIEAESGKQMTFREILHISNKIGKYLKDSGYGVGSVVGVVMEQSFHHPTILLAAMNVGAIYTSVDPRLTPKEMVHNFNVSKPSIIFTTSKLYEKVKIVEPDVTSIKKIVNVDDVVYPECDDTELRYAETTHSDTCQIMYSSGTTGLPKGVKISHKGWIFELEMFSTEKVVPLPEDNVSTALLPTGRAYDLYTVLLSFVNGHKYVSIEHQENVFHYIEKYKINTIYSNPYTAGLLAKQPTQGYDVHSVKLINSAGDFLQVQIKELLKERFGCDFWNNYGLTETTAPMLTAVYSSPSEDVTGRLIPGMMAKVVDLETGEPLTSSKEGELYVKGPTLFNGYLGAAAGEGLDEEGWLHTGDYAMYDSKNNFHIRDRIKMLMKCEGCQVSPVDLELLILKHPEVADVAVGPLKVTGDELPRAYVVKKPRSSVTEEDIVMHVQRNVSPAKRLRGGVKFVEEIPRMNDKIDRKVIKQWTAFDTGAGM